MSSSRHLPLVRQALARHASTSASASSSSSATSTVTAVVPPRTALPAYSLELGPTGLNRLQEHYRSTLSSDLLYMTYDHKLATSPLPAPEPLRRWDESDPYAAQRPVRTARGNRRAPPGTKPFSPTATLRDIPRLERIVLTAFCKDSIGNKNALVPLIAQMRAITGLEPFSQDPSRGTIDVIKAKSGVASFKLRPGMPVGVKATLPAPVALEFLDVLSTFVLPRLRSFAGFPLPPSSQPPMSPAALSGVVSLGMRPEAMALFPQIEINLDQYPGKGLGFQVRIIILPLTSPSSLISQRSHHPHAGPLPD